MENSIQSNKITIIIPARYASTRLEGKPLLKVQDKPIIRWVYERAVLSKLASDVIVATDDKRIFDCVEAFGGKAAMTREDHKSGSDRLVEVLEQYPDITIAVNVQGDEPLITPESIDMAIDVLISDKDADISTLIRKIEADEMQNPNVVKVVKDRQDYAMYFSRSPVPYERAANQAVSFAHIGLYVYRRESLMKMASLEQSMLEKAESLEQLRALENGMKIKTAIVDYKPLGIDTKEDFEEFRKLVEG
ncbi:MAG: 3-deoxy-manno-octulosonate cytidylyltransferase [Candidatus Gastranaerophilales bacterium]|nr:3-deoxy-manno-octulosonate cytidylyltransferase [Candidatus Gastranaerophilales bacterium]